MSRLPYEMLRSFVDVPAGTPPPGILHNFVNPPSQGPTLMALVSIFTPVMLITVGIRLAVNSRALHRLGLDDYTCVIAAVASITHSICILNSLKLGFGRHIWDVHATTLQNIHNIRQMTAIRIIYPVAACFTKISLLLLYLHLFPTSRVQRWGAKYGIAFMVAFSMFYFGIELYSFIQCPSEPVTEQHPFCKDQNFYPIAIFQDSMNLITAFYILTLPIPAIFKLSTSIQCKIGLVVAFVAGLAACITALARLVLTARTFNHSDKFWKSAKATQLSIIELNLALLLSCTPTFPSFISSLKAYWRPKEVYVNENSRGSYKEERSEWMEDLEYHEFPDTKGVSVTWRALVEDGSEGLPGVGKPMGGGGGMF